MKYNTVFMLMLNMLKTYANIIYIVYIHNFSVYQFKQAAGLFILPCTGLFSLQKQQKTQMFENHEQMPSQKSQLILKYIFHFVLQYLCFSILGPSSTQSSFSSFSITAKTGKILQDFGQVLNFL